MTKMPEATSSCLLLRYLLLLALAALGGVGCAAGPQQQLITSGHAPSFPDVAQINDALTAVALQAADGSVNYRLGPEDVLQITLFNVPAGETGVTPRVTEVRVSHEGMITLPLLGDILAAGLTTAALEGVLRERYDRYLRDPQVGVYVKEYRGQQVSVMGAVRNAGVFQLTGPKTLVDLLATAGGISERAGSQVHVYRPTPEGRRSFVVDLLALANNPSAMNMPIQAGDVINVPLAGMFFVDGAINRPGSYPLTRPYTLTQALATAGGANNLLADFSEIAIFRRRNGLEAEKLEVDLNAVFAGQGGDPPIEPDDVIYVPTSTVKFVVDRFLGKIGLTSLPRIPVP